MKKIFCIAIFLLLTCMHFVHAQPYYFRNYQVSNGISGNMVTSILRDSKGFMWFGTRNGLNRFDGTGFKIFRNVLGDTASIGSNSIISMCEDKQQELWIGTYKGIYIYHPKLERFSFFKQLPAKEIRYIKEDSTGNIWILADFKLYRYNPSTNKTQVYALANGEETVSLNLSEQGILWAATSWGNIKSYSTIADSFSTYNVPEIFHLPTLTRIQDLLPISDSEMLIGTMDQALLLNFKTKKSSNIFSETHPPDIQIHKILRQSNNEFWLGTETGIYTFNLQTKQTTHIQKEFWNPYSITDNIIYAFCKDAEGGTWIGTFFGGINYYSAQLNQFRKYFPGNEPGSISGNVVHEICSDDAGHIWIGTEDAGLNMLAPSTGQIKHFLPDGKPGSITYRNIHGLLSDGNQLWVGTYEHGLDRLDIKTGKVIKHYEAKPGPGNLHGNFIVCLYKTRNNTILIGTWNGMYAYDREKDNFSEVPYFNMQIQSMYEDADGTLWVGSYGNGIYYYNSATQKKGRLQYEAGNTNSIPNNYVNNLFADANKNIWICTEAGVCMYEPATGKINRIQTYSDLQAFKILQDHSGLYWISSSRGLYCYDAKTGKSRSYTTADGLLTEQLNYNSGYKDEDGKLYFGSVKGMISFDPAHFIKADYTPPVYITGLQVNNKDVGINDDTKALQQSVMYTSQITLPHDKSSISFEVAALSYVNPDLNEYAYKMDGVDKDWIAMKSNRKIYYTKLAPGHYVFKIKGSGSSKIWNDKERTLAITILPPFVASPLAYCLYTLAAIALALLLIRYYHRTVNEKNKRKMELFEREKEREIYNAKIHFFTNVTHEIRTPLTLIKLPLDKLIQAAAQDDGILSENLHMIKKNTTRLIELTDQLLDFRKAEANNFSLSFTETNITELIKETSNNFRPVAEQKNVLLKEDLPRIPLQAFVDKEALKKILTNLFSNAIKYAKSNVTVSLLPFSSNDDVFTIEIKNDGYLIPFELKEKIFEPFYRLKETEKEPGTGIGLALSRSLAELHNGVLDLREPANGYNTFFLSLPMHQESEMTILKEDAAGSVAKAPLPEPAFINDTSKPNLLIVEDNKEIVQFLQQELSSTYNIYKAYNGQEALHILQEENFQLVISDIMMPIMDGIELCRRMKTDLLFSHIPVILLTAKNTVNAKIEGLEVGADAYIEKPFALGHLQAQISNLLQNRHIIKEYFSRSPLTHIKGIGVSKMDNNFLEELNRIIEENITDADLDVDKLSRLMNMSRPTLYRKIKALSDLSPYDLIALTRLKKGATLLAEGKYKITEIALSIGYSNQSNFSRDFHKQFGTTPSAYQQSLSDNA